MVLRRKRHPFFNPLVVSTIALAGRAEWSQWADAHADDEA
jgi:hypothetical protein